MKTETTLKTEESKQSSGPRPIQIVKPGALKPAVSLNRGLVGQSISGSDALRGSIDTAKKTETKPEDKKSDQKKAEDEDYDDDFD